jgi:hypothetical protein
MFYTFHVPAFCVVYEVYPILPYMQLSKQGIDSEQGIDFRTPSRLIC